MQTLGIENHAFPFLLDLKPHTVCRPSSIVLRARGIATVARFKFNRKLPIVDYLLE